MKTCHRCGSEIPLTAKAQRTDSCPSCYSDVKCCLNCRFYHRSANNQCLEPQAEWCPDKEKANFCEFFEFRETAIGPSGSGSGGSDKDRAKALFDNLFKKG